MSSLVQFCKKIKYNFKDITLLEEAITHPSLGIKKDGIPFNYQRLEFLGDAILGFVLADILFQLYKENDEGELSKKIAFLASRKYCSHVGKEINLDSIIYISKGEEKNGGRDVANNIANSLEALIAAIYLDSKSIKEVSKFIKNFWGSFNSETEIDTKTTLQEWSQENKKTLPCYELVEVSGTKHAPTFKVEVKIGKEMKKIGVGSSKKSAEKDAAEEMLKYISLYLS